MTLESAGGSNTHSLTFNQFTVSVVVEGKEALLYGIERSNDGKTVNCWVESEAGKSFGVQWRDSERTGTLSGSLWVDGIPCGALAYKAGDSNRLSKIDYCDAGSTRRKLKFSDIETTDDDAYYGQTISEVFGRMRLLMRRIAVTGKAGGPIAGREALEKVHEKSKKAMSHQMKFGEEVSVGKKWVSVKYIEDLATFIIRYRPKDFLQANDIMPRPKKRKADPDDIIDLTLDGADESEEDKIRELQAQIEAIQEKKKQKPNKRMKKEVKQETPVL